MTVKVEYWFTETGVIRLGSSGVTWSKSIAAANMLRFVSVPLDTAKTSNDEIVVPTESVHSILPLHSGTENQRILVYDESDITANDADTLKIAISRARNGRPYKRPVPVVAAGGYVTRATSEGLQLLLIYRRGVWDLPKGKLDRGETIEDAALREVREEVGVDSLRITRDLGRTVHGYPDGETYAVKTTYWFLMETKSISFTPQSEEQIESVEWFHWEDARDILGYDSLRNHIRSIEPLIFI